MSMYLCDGCKALTDTDDYPDNWDSEGRFFCDVCVAAHEQEGRELAAEHQRDLNAMGCTCRFDTDPDNGEHHYKRDRNCPMHGIDPDAARDDAQDRSMRR